jgi:hypothetical protein
MYHSGICRALYASPVFQSRTPVTERDPLYVLSSHDEKELAAGVRLITRMWDDIVLVPCSSLPHPCLSM